MFALIISTAWPTYPGTLPVDSSLGSAGSGSSGGSGGSGGHQVSSFEATPYTSPMGSSAAAAAAYYSTGGSTGDRKHGHHGTHGLAFWPNDYKYAGGPTSALAECNAAAFGAQSWCNYSPYAPRVPSHMDTHGSNLNAAYITAAAAAADDRRSGVEAPSFHDSYALRNAYGASEISASPYPPPGQ